MRDFLRFFFKLSIGVLSVAACTQSVVWLGETTKAYDDYSRKQYYKNTYNIGLDEDYPSVTYPSSDGRY